MSEDQNDQSTGQPTDGPEQESPPTPVAETTGEAIALPGPAPTPTAEPVIMPAQPDTQPQGVPQGVPLGMAHTMDNASDPVTAPQSVPEEAPATTGSTPPQGTYAMGALAGNPALDEPVPVAATSGDAGGSGGYNGPPTDPNAPIWSAPRAGVGGTH